MRRVILIPRKTPTITATFRSLSQSLKDVTPADPSKEPTESIRQAKDEDGPNPAEQQAKIVKQQNPSAGQGEEKGHGQTQGDLSYAKTVNIASKDEGGAREGKEGKGGGSPS